MVQLVVPTLPIMLGRDIQDLMPPTSFIQLDVIRYDADEGFVYVVSSGRRSCCKNTRETLWFSCCESKIYFVSVLNAPDRVCVCAQESLCVTVGGLPGCSPPTHHDLEGDHRWLEWTFVFSLFVFLSSFFCCHGVHSVLTDALKGFCVSWVSILRVIN